MSRRICLALAAAFLFGCNANRRSTSNVEAQPPGEPGTGNRTGRQLPSARGGEGDTVLIFLHRIRPGRQTEYEELMTEIWGNAHAKAAASGKGEWAWSLAATRDFVPFGSAPRDSSPTYFIIIDPAPPNALTDTTGSFPQDLLIDAGYSPAQADSLAERLRATIEHWDGYARLQRAFNRR